MSCPQKQKLLLVHTAIAFLTKVRQGWKVSRLSRHYAGQHYILLATEQKRQYRNASNRVFRIRRPHMDASLQLTEGDLAANYTRVDFQDIGMMQQNLQNTVACRNELDFLPLILLLGIQPLKEKRSCACWSLKKELITVPRVCSKSPSRFRF